ncbi:MAG: DUF4837 family protein [Calditrichaeota bacterium]|nr:MAG: DUF4837 family protein [Calditrichota bacterium]
MYRRFILGLFWLLPLLMVVVGCKQKPEAIGNLDEIIVFADSVDWPVFKDGLQTFFGKEYIMPVVEKEFLLRWKSFDDFENFKHYKNIMFIGYLNSKLPVSQTVTDLLNEEVVAGVKSGDYFYIPQKDVWAMKQYVVFLVAPTKDDMIQRIYDLGELVYDDFRKSYYQRLQERMFEHLEKKELEEYIADHYGFTLRIPADYVLVDESSEENYIWLRRLHPDRSLFVHWLPYMDSVTIDFDWIVKKRNEIAAKLYEGDIIVEDETHLEKVQFAGRPAYRMEGTWKNPKHMVGGPFRNTTFVVQERNMIYMIDFYVQAIGQRKKLYLDQLDIMAHTFKLVEKSKGEE